MSMDAITKALEKMEAREKAATCGPWKACETKDAFENWPVCPNLGADDDGKSWAVTTDSVRASEYTSGGSGADAKFIASARTDLRKLVGALREAVARLEEIEDTIKDARCGCCMDTTAAVCLDQIASILGDQGSRGQG